MPARTVLVTGAAAGIGAGVARRFAESHDRVAVLDVDGPAARDFAGTLPEALAIQADVADEAQVIAAVAEVTSKLGPIDILVNNAGIEVSGSISDLNSTAWDRQLAVNLRGVFLMSKYALAQMPESGGAIVNISSIHAFVSYTGCAAYDTTKAGLVGLTRAMALDHGPAHIRVNAVCPGYIDTPLNERWLQTVPDREATMRQVLAAHPLGRTGTPRDVAEAVFFLCSEAASFISGACLVVDGAMSIAGH